MANLALGKVNLSIELMCGLSTGQKTGGGGGATEMTFSNTCMFSACMQVFQASLTPRRQPREKWARSNAQFLDRAGCCPAPSTEAERAVLEPLLHSVPSCKSPHISSLSFQSCQRHSRCLFGSVAMHTPRTLTMKLLRKSCCEVEQNDHFFACLPHDLLHFSTRNLP